MLKRIFLICIILLVFAGISQAADYNYRVYFVPSEVTDSTYSIAMKFSAHKQNVVNPLFCAFLVCLRFNPNELVFLNYQIGEKFQGWMVEQNSFEGLWNVAGATGNWGVGNDGIVCEVKFKKNVQSLSSPPSFETCIFEESALGWWIPLKVEYQAGDVNTDGFVTIDDYFKLVEYVFAGKGKVPQNLSDVNRDGSIDFGDCLGVLRRIR